MIEIIKYAELNGLRKDKLNAFITIEFGHIPIVQETEWAQPDYSIINADHGTIKTFYNIVEREILVDNVKMKIGGINNVITPKQFRGKGYAARLLKETENFIFDQLNCELGVLLCADDLITFYKKLGWYVVDCPVYFEQSSGEKLWKANTMFLSRSSNLNPKLIKLNGLPW